MKKAEKIIKIGLSFIALVAIAFPFVQSEIKVLKISPLNGAIEKVARPAFSFRDWFSGDYQDKAEKYVKNAFSFRAPFIRLHNQIDYTVFNKTHAAGVVVGRENYLYEKNYIRATLGMNFLGSDTIRAEVEKLRIIRDSLANHGVQLVVLLAPGKGSFYPNYFPKEYDSVQPDTTNYEMYRKYLLKDSIHLLDFKKWFETLKPKVNEQTRLFSKTGIHWSRYGEVLAADSILRYFHSLTHLPFPDLVIDSLEKSTKPRYTDNDIGKGLNLLVNIPDFELTYPVCRREHEDRNQTTVLTLSDSYFWGLFNMGLSRDYFNNGEFWYYNEVRYPNNYEADAPVSAIDIFTEMKKAKIVLNKHGRQFIQIS